MSNLLDTVAQFFTDTGWEFSRDDQESILLTGYEGDNGRWPFFAWAIEEHHQVALYSQMPAPIPEARRGAAAEYITRANYDMIIGSFDLDLEDGDCRFKTSIDVTSDRLSVALVGQMVLANVIMMDRYLPGLIEVIENDVEPAVAVAAVEAKLPRFESESESE